MKKAVIYARYSSHSQRDESIDAQLRECHEFATKNDYIILDEYCDRALTGKTDNRASFQRMIKDAKQNKFNYVLVYKLDRFARNRYDSAMYKNILKKHNIKVVSIKENISDNPEGIILESVLEGMAEYYSANLSQNIKRGMTENALKCKFNGSGCPLGYRITPDKYYEIDEAGAKIVKEIFTMYGNGKNRSEIIDYCNNKGYKTSRGQDFNKNSVDRILTNEKYIGTYRHGDIVIEKGIPAIIDDFLFNKVQTMLKKNYKSRARSKAIVDYVLSGKLFCGHCKETMVGISGTSKSGKKHHYYKCSTRKDHHSCNKENERKEWLEDVVIKSTVEQILTDENIELIAKKAMELIEADNADTSELKYYENELKETRKQIKNIVDMVAKGVANKSIADRLTELENYETDVITNLEYAKMKKPTLTKEQIIYWLETFRYGDINDIEYKRKIVNTLIHSIYVYDIDGNKRKIVLNFNTSANNQLELECSTTASFAPPTGQYTNTLYMESYTVFTYVIEIESMK
jgi:DNA invertase Pin-like site-specific DNA recombinase